MATVHEIYNSREGGSIGVFGSQALTTTWRVTLDAIGDDPVATLANTPGGAAIGNPYPSTGPGVGDWDPNELVALFASRREHITPDTWLVDVFYGPPIVVGTTSAEWDMSISSSIETEEVFADLDGITIGPFKYAESSTQRSSHFTNLATGSINLQQPSGGREGTRYAKSTTRRRGIGSLIITKIVANFPSSAFSDATFRIDNVNVEPFTVPLRQSNLQIENVRIADPGFAIFDGVEVFPLDAVVPGQGIPGRGYRVTLTFKLDAQGWQHNLTHTYIDGLGSESIVFRSNGDREEEEFKIQHVTNLSQLVSNFG